jgi:hypothetical protein
VKFPGEEPIGIGDWVRAIYDDEVMWWSKDLCCRQRKVTNISQYPLVPGFFITEFPDEYADLSACTRILAGPFKTLEIAIASIALLA